MVPMNFYLEYGKAAFAMAMADGEIQHEEKRQIAKEIETKLVPLETRTDAHGVNIAHSTCFPFETEEPMDDKPRQAIERFAAFLERKDVHIPPALGEQLISMMRHVAEAYGQVEDEERAVLDLFESHVRKHMAEA